jgi:hypothetical protein
MSATIVRLMLSVILMVAIPIAYVVLFILLERPWSDEGALLGAGGITLGVFAPAWIRIWSGQVTWTSRRIGLTAACGVGALGVGLVVGALCNTSYAGDELAILSGAAAAFVLWPIGTILVWRETPLERGERLQTLGIRAIACPKCGYNMTGLKQSICPECGASFTLDELFASLKEEKGTLPEETRVT